ncbi:MAG: prepilin-type N-terminal cleavage/methylation domain-containing protein [Clostridiaceae bacterium]|nr:prepilin-type N-terminal cleavage/methylation domain-containing protein [Clostridiaceae bacterium]
MMIRRSANRQYTSAGAEKTGKKPDRKGFSLAELIMAIALLSIFGVIAARMFFVSDGLSRKTEQIDRSVILAANIAEAWQGVPTEGSYQLLDSKSLAGFKPKEFVASPVKENVWQASLDGQLLPVVAGQDIFLLTVRQKQTDIEDVWQIMITIEEVSQNDANSQDSDGELIYELTASRYLPAEVAK